MSEEMLILPYNVKIEDMDAVTEFLRSRPTGASYAQLQRTLGKKLTDDRKVALYLLTGFVSIDGGKWRLTGPGSDYAHADEAGRCSLLRNVLRSYEPYHEVLSWMHHQAKESVTADEVRHKWANEFAGSVSVENKYRLSGAPLTFFGLCQRARLGRYVLGRRGAPSRLETDTEELRSYIGSADSPPMHEEKAASSESASKSPRGTIGRTSDAPARLVRSASPEFAFPLSNNMTISIILPDAIPAEDTDTLRAWFDLMMKSRTKSPKQSKARV